MAIALAQEHDPYLDGLGKSSNLGVCFLRRVQVTHTAPDTVATITAAALGVAKIVRTLSIVRKSSHTVYQSALSESSVEFTASGNTAVYDVFLLVAGM